jgi:hypothetical protein
MTDATNIPRELLGSGVERLGIASDVSPSEFCRQKAEECLDLSYEITDPKRQVAVLRLANWWMRLGENYHSPRPR